MAKRKTGRLGTVFAHGVLMIVRALGVAVRLLPAWSWTPIAWVLSRVLWVVLRRHRHRTLANVAAVRGLTGREAKRFSKASFFSNTLVLIESLAMPRIIARRGVRVDVEIDAAAADVLDRVQRGETPFAIGIGAHAGVWELLGADFARRALPAPTMVSARLPKNPTYARYLRRMRSGFGLTLVDKEVYLRTLLRRAKRGEPTFCNFLCDQHTKGGLVVPFMGKPACTVTIPAVLIRRFDAPALFGSCIRRRAGHYVLRAERLDYSHTTGLPADEAVERITRDLNERISASIEQAPEQWTWGHRRWRSKCCERTAQG